MELIHYRRPFLWRPVHGGVCPQSVEKVWIERIDGLVANGFDDLPNLREVVHDLRRTPLAAHDILVRHPILHLAAEKSDDGWQVNQWLKKAVLLSFRLTDNQVMPGAYSRFYDKVPLKYADYDEEDFVRDGVPLQKNHKI